MPHRVSNASAGTNMASESTNQAAIVGTNAPRRSNCDCIRLSLQHHARAHEIGAKHCRSDDDPAQCLDFLRLGGALDCCEGMATERTGLPCPPAEFPGRRIAKGLRQPSEQTPALGGDSRRRYPPIEGVSQTADGLRG